MKEQLAQEEWGQDVPTTDWDRMSQPRFRGKLPGRTRSGTQELFKRLHARRAGHPGRPLTPAVHGKRAVRLRMESRPGWMATCPGHMAGARGQPDAAANWPVPGFTGSPISRRIRVVSPVSRLFSRCAPKPPEEHPPRIADGGFRKRDSPAVRRLSASWSRHLSWRCSSRRSR